MPTNTTQPPTPPPIPISDADFIHNALSIFFFILAAISTCITIEQLYNHFKIVLKTRKERKAAKDDNNRVASDNLKREISNIVSELASGSNANVLDRMEEQFNIVIIIAMVPLFSFASAISFYNANEISDVIGLARDMYEGLVLYAFMDLMVDYFMNDFKLIIAVNQRKSLMLGEEKEFKEEKIEREGVERKASVMNSVIHKGGQAIETSFQLVEIPLRFVCCACWTLDNEEKNLLAAALKLYSDNPESYVKTLEEFSFKYVHEDTLGDKLILTPLVCVVQMILKPITKLAVILIGFFSKCLPKKEHHTKLSVDFIKQSYRGPLLFALIKPGGSFILLILRLMSWGNTWNHTTTVINGVQTVTLSVAMYYLLSFEHALSDALQFHQPMPKFFTIKGILFVAFWYEKILNFLNSFFHFHFAAGAFDDKSVILCLSDGMMVLLMIVAAIAHGKYYPYQVYGPRTSIFSSCFKKQVSPGN